MLADALAAAWRRRDVARVRLLATKHRTTAPSRRINEFEPLDGKFAPNVLVQVKNGAIDFQPREPFHPLFGAMPKTPLMMEFQITKEYLGFATHLVYLGPLYEEVLRLRHVRAKGKGSTVAKVDRRLAARLSPTGIAGVANIGADRNWTGSHFDQANWYAFGRLAWDPDLSSRDIAEEWVRMTFSQRRRLRARRVVAMMMALARGGGRLHDAARPASPHATPAITTVPGPWVGNLTRRLDSALLPPRRRRRASVSTAGPRAATPWRSIRRRLPRLFADRRKVPERVPAVVPPRSVGLQDALRAARCGTSSCYRYTRGVDVVSQMRAHLGRRSRPMWMPSASRRSPPSWRIQEQEAQWWRDACIAYFQTFSERPLPEGFAPPAASARVLPVAGSFRTHPAAERPARGS